MSTTYANYNSNHPHNDLHDNNGNEQLTKAIIIITNSSSVSNCHEHENNDLTNSKSSDSSLSSSSFEEEPPVTFTSPSTFTFYDHMDTFHGIRCINSFLIVLFHISQGILSNVLSQEQNFVCLYGGIRQRFGTVVTTVIRRILDTILFRITYHMTLFWILSGFLCEYQLHRMYLKNLEQQQKDRPKQVQLSYKDYMNFFINRLLRIWPLYCLLPIWGYRMIEHQQPYSFTTSELIKTFLFQHYWTYDRSMMLASNTWSVQVDIHGYIAIILVFMFFPTCYYYTSNTNDDAEGKTNTIPEQEQTNERYRNTKYKRCILMMWYVGSLVYTLAYLRILPHQHLSDSDVHKLMEWGTCGIEFMATNKTIMLGLQYDKYEMYPDIDFDNHSVKSMNNYMNIIMDNSYFRSYNHGSAMLLGSLLYLQLYCIYGNRNNKKQVMTYESSTSSIKSVASVLFSWIEPNYIPLCQWVFAWILLIATTGFFLLSGIASFLIVYSILTMKFDRSNHHYDEDINIMKKIRYDYIDPCIDIFYRTIVTICRHPMMKWLATYTYGIYIFHYPIMLKRSEMQSLIPKQVQIIKQGAVRGISACQALDDAGMTLNIMYVIKEGTIVFMIALLCSIVFYHMIEVPIWYIRESFIKKRNHTHETYDKSMVGMVANNKKVLSKVD